MSTSASARSYLTAGIAVVGAGAIAVTPVAPVGPDPALLSHRIGEMAVSLTAAVTPVDPIQNIIDIVTAAGENIGALVNNFGAGLYVNGTFPFPPNTVINGNLGWRTGGYATGTAFPIIAQTVNNLISYIGELPDIATILGQVFGNIGNALGAPFAVGVEESARALGIIPDSPYNQNVNAVPYVTIPDVATVSQRDIWALLPLLAGDSYASLKPILDATTTPISGLLVGAIGPIVAPVLAVVNGLSNTLALLQESDFGGALTELINIPANAIGALLNGGPVLDLTPLLGLAGITLPDSIKSIGLQMGGLLSPGGVAFDALAAEADALGSTLVIPGLPIGPIGALTSLNNYVAKSIVVTPPTQAETPAAASTSEAAADTVADTDATASVTVDSASESVAAQTSDSGAAASLAASEVEVSAASAESAPRAAEAEAAVSVSAPREATGTATGEATAEQAEDTGATTVRRAPRADRGTDSGAATSTPKRAARGAVSRAG